MKNCFLKPASVAVVGASTNPDKMGNFVLANIINGGFAGQITPINPKAETVLGLTAYPSVSDMDHVPELVVSLHRQEPFQTSCQSVPAMVFQL